MIFCLLRPFLKDLRQLIDLPFHCFGIKKPAIPIITT